MFPEVLGKLLPMEQNVSVYKIVDWGITDFSEAPSRMFKDISYKVWGIGGYTYMFTKYHS